MLDVASALLDNKQRPVSVHSVQVHGAVRTREWVLEKWLADPLMESNTLESLMGRLHDACEHLSSLGIYSEIDLTLDTAPVQSLQLPVTAPDAVVVIVRLREKPRLFVKTGTEIGANEGTLNARAVCRNVFGAGEAIEASVARGTRTTGAYQFSLSKPIGADHKNILQLTASQSEQDWLKQSSYIQVLRDVSLRWMRYTRSGIHELSTVGSWRELGSLPDNCSLNIRELAGHSTKLALAHTFTRDSRNDASLPTRGCLWKLMNEMALVDSRPLFKTEFESQYCRSLTTNSSLACSIRAGWIGNISQPSDRVSIHDRFFLGGPWTIRGFRTRGIGPRAAQLGPFSDDSLGGTRYWACGLSLFTPLPMLLKYAHIIKSHMFLNAAGLYDSPVPTSLSWKSFTPCTVSTGVGLAVQTSFCRLETNFTWPLAMVANRDIPSPRFQIGIGMNFL